LEEKGGRTTVRRWVRREEIKIIGDAIILILHQNRGMKGGVKSGELELKRPVDVKKVKHSID